MCNYSVVIHKESTGGYWAEVTGMPGCLSCGDTLAEVKAGIREAASAWMESQIAMAFRNVVRVDASGKTIRRKSRTRALA